jgi:hypothetical protein
LLEALEQTEGDLRPALMLVAGQSVQLDEGELRPALRRAMLLLAAAGDPHEQLELDGRAVTALADELDAPERRAELVRGIDPLREAAEGLPSVEAALEQLGDEDLAWRAFACALLADEVIEEI